MGSRYKVGYNADFMVPYKESSSVVRTRYRIEIDGICEAYGDTVPADAATGYAPGCQFQHVDGGSGDLVYINEGSVTSASFKPLQTIEGIQETYQASSADDGGGSPLIWDGAPLLEVMLDPSKGYHFFTDFFEGDYTSAASLWTVTQNASGTLTNDAANQGGGCVLDAGAATTAQGITCQMHGISIKPEPDTTIRIEWRCKNNEGAGFVAMGLGAVGTTDWSSDGSIETGADCALFFRDSGTGDTDWSTQIGDGSSVQAVDDVFSASDTGYETYGIVIVGDGADADDSVTFYRNGVAAATVTDVSDMPDAVLVPTFEDRSDGTDQPVINLDWLRILVSNSTDGSRA